MWVSRQADRLVELTADYNLIRRALSSFYCCCSQLLQSVLQARHCRSCRPVLQLSHSAWMPTECLILLEGISRRSGSRLHCLALLQLSVSGYCRASTWSRTCGHRPTDTGQNGRPRVARHTACSAARCHGAQRSTIRRRRQQAVAQCQHWTWLLMMIVTMEGDEGSELEHQCQQAS